MIELRRNFRMTPLQEETCRRLIREGRPIVLPDEPISIEFIDDEIDKDLDWE